MRLTFVLCRLVSTLAQNMRRHMVDSVAFPFQSTSFPSMSRNGAYSPDHIYTHADVRDIVEYVSLFISLAQLWRLTFVGVR